MTQWRKRRQLIRRMVIAAASYVTCSAFVGARSDPEFMRYDAGARRVELSVIAAFDQSHSGYNFNGGFHGSHRITVPTGWTIHVTFVNRDVIPHSVVVTPETKRLPLRVARPAFAGAASRLVQQGLPSGARQDDIVFVVSRAGSYLLTCGVPAHTVLGTYLLLIVSDDATVPTYKINPAAAPVAPS